MGPLFAIGPAALMRLFQEELLVRINAVVHETGKLVFYSFELIIRDRLRDGCEAAPMACRVRQPCVRQPCGGAQEGHALAVVLFTAAGGPRSTRFCAAAGRR